jgi:O-antigen/teichoic acid export membrane protein
MRRAKQVLQYLVILAVFAAIGFIPLEKPRSPRAASGPQASARTTCR